MGDLYVPQNGIEWRTQVVRHGGDKLVLHAGQLFEVSHVVHGQDQPGTGDRGGGDVKGLVADVDFRFGDAGNRFDLAEKPLYAGRKLVASSCFENLLGRRIDCQNLTFDIQQNDRIGGCFDCQR